MTTRIKQITLAGAVTLLLSFIGIAGGTANGNSAANLSPQNSGPAANSADALFVKHAAQQSAGQAAMGLLAAHNATSPKVKQFGQRMVMDDAKINDKLASAAAKDKISFPTTLDTSQQVALEQMARLTGSEFNRVYAQVEVRDHETEIAEFGKEVASGKQPAIKNFAEQALPTLKEQLRLAKDMDQSIGSGSAGSPNPGGVYPGNPRSRRGDPNWSINGTSTGRHVIGISARGFVNRFADKLADR